MSSAQGSTPEEQTLQENDGEKMRKEARESLNSLRLDSTSISSLDSERTPIEVVESFFLSSSNTKEDSKLITSSNSLINNSSSFSSTATTTSTDEDDVYSLDPSSYRNNSYRPNRSYRSATSNRKKLIPSSSSIVSFSSTRSALSTNALLGMQKQVKKSSKKVYESIKYQYKLSSVINKSERLSWGTKETVDDDLLSATEWSQVTISPNISMRKVSFSLLSNLPSRLVKTKKQYRKSVKKLRKKISNNNLSHDCRDDTEIRAIRIDSSIAPKNVIRSVSVLASGTIPMDYSSRENMRINFKHAVIYIILYVSILILSYEWGTTSSALKSNELRFYLLDYVENNKVQSIEFKQEVAENNDKYEDYCNKEFIHYLFEHEITSIADNVYEFTSILGYVENHGDKEEANSQVIIHDISSEHTDTTLPVIKTQKHEDSFVSKAINKMFHHAIEGSKNKQTDDKLFQFIVGVL